MGVEEKRAANKVAQGIATRDGRCTKLTFCNCRLRTLDNFAGVLSEYLSCSFKSSCDSISNEYDFLALAL